MGTDGMRLMEVSRLVVLLWKCGRMFGESAQWYIVRIEHSNQHGGIMRTNSQS